MKHEMKYIYEVYQEKSFSQAAKNLFISQPALSSSIRKAEREIGFEIFDRNTLPIRLTEAGKLYIEAAEKIMAVERELDGRLSEMANLKTGRVVVAGANFFSACMLPPVIHTFVSRYPGVDLELVESDSMVLYEEALKDNIDLIFDAGVYDSSLFVSETLSAEHIVLAVPRDNPLNRAFAKIALTRSNILAGRHLSGSAPSADISAFAAEPFLLLKRGHDMHRRSLDICRRAGFTPRTSLYLNQLSTVANMACQGLGCCFLTDTVIRLLLTGRSPLVYYPVNDPAAKRDIFIAHPLKKPVTKAMATFIGIARETFSQRVVENCDPPDVRFALREI